jgi:outer membrane biogenesis lipoprotein LolB
MRFRKIVFVSSVCFVVSGCGSQPSKPQQIVAVTRPVGSWQGRGTATVGDIPSETGRFRITWRTSNESPAGTGRFKLTLRSAISGRTLGIVADHAGAGTGTVEYDEGPRTYDFLVESTNVDWSFQVEETTGAFANGSPPFGSAQGGPFVPGKR